MTSPRFDLTPFLDMDEGQHFDRKSLFEGPPGSKRSRDRRTVRDQVAEYVAAFANAEGGVLVIGIEDDGTLTGHALPARALAALLTTPSTRLSPAQPKGFVLTVEDHEVIVFDVPMSDVPVQVIGDGFPLRINDHTLQASESQISALKFAGMAESWEARPSPLTLADLDPELLFATHGPDHPNAGVRVFRVIGTERRLGVEHNVEERPRIEGNLPQVVEEATTLIASLLADLSIDELLTMARVHKSRNPRVVRALVDLGVVRDQGEGIPRMFAEMEGQFLPAPEIQSTRRDFTVVLRNTPTLSQEDRAFVASLGSNELSDTEFRALLEAHRHGRVDNASLRRIAGLDTLEASRLLGALRDRELLSLHGGGAKSYYTLGRAVPRIDPTSADRPQLEADRPQLEADRPQLATDRPQLAALPEALQEMVSALGARPRKDRLWPIIVALCALRAYRPAELASILGFRRPKLLVKRHLSPMVDAGLIERTHPDTPNHPDQAYRAVSEATEDSP